MYYLWMYYTIRDTKDVIFLQDRPSFHHTDPTVEPTSSLFIAFA